VKEQRGCSHGSAGLGYQARSGDNGAHGGANLRFGYGDDAVNKSLDVGEVETSHALRAEAVGDGPADKLGRPCDDGAVAKTLGSVAGQLGFDAEDLDLRAELFDGRGDTREQAAAGDRGQHQIYVGQGLGDFQAARSLPRDDLLVIVRRDDHVAVLADKLLSHGEAFARCQAHIHNFSPEASVAARLMGGAFEGITITAFAPTTRAA